MTFIARRDQCRLGMSVMLGHLMYKKVSISEMKVKEHLFKIVDKRTLNTFCVQRGIQVINRQLILIDDCTS